MTPWQNHRNKWKDCKRCQLWRTRKNVVLGRGELPCSILFIGEAPGRSEDVIGQPFVGPAGRLLSHILDLAGITKGYFISNILGCIPLGKEGDKVQVPNLSAARCSTRLEELYQMARPRLVVLLGEIARKYWPNKNCDMLYLPHPAAILRTDVTQRGLMLKRCVLDLIEKTGEIDV